MHQWVLASGSHWLAIARNSWPNRMEGSVTKPAKELVTKPSKRQLPERMALFSPLEAVHFLIRKCTTSSWCCFFYSQITQGQESRGGGGNCFSHSQSLCRIFGSHSSKFELCCIEILVLLRMCFSQGHHHSSTELEDKT